jgi:hypothetical protein
VNVRTTHLLLGLSGLLLALALPLAGHWLRQQPAGGCALDGARIDAAYRVRIVNGAGRDHCFCCIRCAELWLERHRHGPQAVYVIDEASGEEMRAEGAYFVRSRVVTQPATLNRVHAFRDRADAERHADRFRGAVLADAERPFQSAR